MRVAATSAARASAGKSAGSAGKITAKSGRSGVRLRTAASARACSASSGLKLPVTTASAPRGSARAPSGVRILDRVSIGLSGSRSGPAMAGPLPETGGLSAFIGVDRRLTLLLRAFHQLARYGRHALRRDARHAAVVDRAFAQQTRRAFRVLADHAGERARGTRRRVIRRAEY